MGLIDSYDCLYERPSKNMIPLLVQIFTKVITGSIEAASLEVAAILWECSESVNFYRWHSSSVHPGKRALQTKRTRPFAGSTTLLRKSTGGGFLFSLTCLTVGLFLTLVGLYGLVSELNGDRGSL